MKKVPLSIAESIVMVGVRLRTIANRFVFSPAGITSSQFRILRMLCCDGSKRPSDIMKFAGGTKSNVSQRLNSLEKDGLIRRLAPKQGEDRRNVMIEATPKGEQMIENLLGRFQKSTDALNSKFTDEEIKALFAFLNKLNRVLDENEKRIPEVFDQ